MRERTVKTENIFKGRVLTVELLDVELADGMKTTREIVRHNGAVGILCRLPDGRFVLVRQYRKAAETEMVEIVAGSLEKGEAPRACAIRETLEETGHRVLRIGKLGSIWLAPGYSSERLHLYWADVAAGRGADCQDPDERIGIVILSGRQIESMIRSGKVCDSKTICAWHLWNAEKGERL